MHGIPILAYFLCSIYLLLEVDFSLEDKLLEDQMCLLVPCSVPSRGLLEVY